MRILFCLFVLLMVTACGRELHMHKQEYAYMKEIEANKRETLKVKAANLAVRYATKASNVDDIAESIVDACAVELNDVVLAAAEVKTGELGGGFKEETTVDEYQETLRTDLRRVLWVEVKAIVKAERAKLAPVNN